MKLSDIEKYLHQHGIIRAAPQQYHVWQDKNGRWHKERKSKKYCYPKGGLDREVE